MTSTSTADLLGFDYVYVAPDPRRRRRMRRAKAVIAAAMIGLGAAAFVATRADPETARLSLAAKREVDAWMNLGNPAFARLGAANDRAAPALDSAFRSRTWPDLALTAACTELQAAAAGLQTLPAMPAPALDRTLRRSLAGYDRAARLCLATDDGGIAEGLALVTRARHALSSAGADLGRLSDDIDTVRKP